jgi:hypothetical protein
MVHVHVWQIPGDDWPLQLQTTIHLRAHIANGHLLGVVCVSFEMIPLSSSKLEQPTAEEVAVQPALEKAMQQPELHHAPKPPTILPAKPHLAAPASSAGSAEQEGPADAPALDSTSTSSVSVHRDSCDSTGRPAKHTTSNVQPLQNESTKACCAGKPATQHSARPPLQPIIGSTPRFPSMHPRHRRQPMLATPEAVAGCSQ